MENIEFNHEKNIAKILGNMIEVVKKNEMHELADKWAHILKKYNRSSQKK